MTRILVISDTHGKTLEVMPPRLIAELEAADIVVHCGDYNGIALLHELRQRVGSFVGVYGNMDPPDIRREVPDRATFEVEGRRIGVIHPHWGGPPFNIVRDISREFKGVDVILYGHTHDAACQLIGGVVFLNPGQAYSSYNEPATAGIVTIDGQDMTFSIRVFG